MGSAKHSSRHIAHPISQECRVYIQEQILDAYSKECGEQNAGGDMHKPAADNVPDDKVGQVAVEDSVAEQQQDIGEGTKDIEL